MGLILTANPVLIIAAASRLALARADLLLADPPQADLLLAVRA
jgi:hypothetical protein